MSMIGTKTPDEIKDYSFDWTKDLGTDTIVNSGASNWTILPEGPAITQSGLSANGLQSTVWVAGGTVDQVYEITNEVTTTAGRTLSKTFRLMVVAENYI